jgi:hypothetical protein
MAHGFCFFAAVRRALVLLRGPLDAASLRARCQVIAAESGEVAVCLVLEEHSPSLAEAVDAQRAITRALRMVLGDKAETIAVFVASGREGDRVEDWAREWGATVVIA